MQAHPRHLHFPTVPLSRDRRAGSISSRPHSAFSKLSNCWQAGGCNEGYVGHERATDLAPKDEQDIMGNNAIVEL